MALSHREHAVMTISCQGLHEFCRLIFMDQMHTTKSTKFIHHENFYVYGTYMWLEICR